jgi:hypothetical protein
VIRRAILVALFSLGCAGAERTVIPTRMAGEDRTMQLFEVRIGDRADVYWFLIDTGSSYTFIDAKIAERHGLTVREGTPVRGAGGVEVKTRAVDGVPFTIGGNATTFDDVRVTDLSGLEPMFGHRIDGFFGYPLLERFVVTIDPVHQRIVLTAPSLFHPHPSDSSLPLRSGGKTNRWIYVRATIKYPGNAPEQSEFFVDSGSQDDANHPSVRKSTGPLREIRTGTGLGSVGAGAGVIGRAEWIRLGPFEVAGVESSCCPPLEGTERMIGQGVLSKFIVTYDYSRKRMLIRRR